MYKIIRVLEYLVLMMCFATLVMLCYEFIKAYFTSGSFMVCIRIDRHNEYYFEIPIWLAGSAFILKNALKAIKEAIAGEDM